MSPVTPARYVVKKRERSHHVEYAMLVCVSHVEPQKRAYVRIVMRQCVRSVMSSWHLVHVTPAGNWSVRTTESRSMSPRYVTTVGRMTDG